ncbi:MAG: photosynthetic reaction center cytochrome PufC [Aquabacterium sp.]|nr:photosynthetic reaction center cytochrome PufC [Aquabacterium sp.]
MRAFNRAVCIGVVGLALLVAGCERPPLAAAQKGYRGTGMAQVDNLKALEAQAALHAAPEIARPARVRENAPLAGATYKNVQVLGELTIGEFGRTMNAITAWVSPQQSCAHCHVDGDFASDAKYTKVVARRMIQMVRHLNTDWQAHIANTGVTCYTCHRGNPVPRLVWFKPQDRKNASAVMGDLAGQNAPAPSVAYASLPSDPFTPYLLNNLDIRVNGSVAMAQSGAAANRHSTKQAEHTFALMVHISKSLGVNCTFCHNTRSFDSWPQSLPQRATAWHGIRMVRDLNISYIEPLTPNFPAVPAGRLGPGGDAAKVHCATCHQGASKPLYGAQTARYYPALWVATTPGSVAGAALAPSPVPAADVPASAPQPGLPASAVEGMARAAAPAIAALAPGEPNCVHLAASNTRAATRIPEASVNRQLTGGGRVQFHSAPDAGCVMQGIFALSGEPVEAAREIAGYTLVWYRNPRTGGEASGWVRSGRLQPITAEAAKALATVATGRAPAVAAAPAPSAPVVVADADCMQLSLAALEKGTPVPPGNAGLRVVGSGRLQFHAAPDASCRMQGVFILPGEPVEADRALAGYTAVWYRNPRTGGEATGWVRSNRLAAGAAPVTQRP